MNHSTGPRARDFWTPARTALTLTTLALVAALGVASCGKSADTQAVNAPKATVTVGTKPNGPAAPPATPAGPRLLPASALDAPLETLEGKPFKLSDLKGKVLILDLWATWCGPCRSSIPELVNLQKEFGPKGLEVIGLDIDPDSDTPEDVKAFAKEFDINYKLAFADRELAISLMRGGNIPQSIIVNRDGQIIEHMVGFHPVNTPKRMRAAIEQALQ
ncbi:MAG TPA: TlpA disulfide reductase family protein [Pyrinomonadaceae bacterium]|jgi:cytochrome c biogenesis protein CcmG/thiol:disulfide interchange protein DsbE